MHEYQITEHFCIKEKTCNDNVTTLLVIYSVGSNILQWFAFSSYLVVVIPLTHVKVLLVWIFLYFDFMGLSIREFFEEKKYEKKALNVYHSLGGKLLG